MKYLLLLLLLIFSINAYSAETYQRGKVTNITSTAAGLLVMLDVGKPSGCTQNSGWMLIPKENTTMISVALAMHMAGKNNATIYVDVNALGGYCKVVQFDPHP